jgi:cephalosporin-C deacetylase-like acetyl esterase
MCREYLKTRSEWDGETIIARGGSMGGAQTIVASAGEPKVKLCLAGAPAMCDHQGFLNGMTSGWPALFKQPVYKAGGEKHDAAMKTMPYFDVVNFAKRVKCKAIISVGLIDYVCPPSGVTIVYNNLKCPKKITYVHDSDHGYANPGAMRFEKESK